MIQWNHCTVDRRIGLNLDEEVLVIPWPYINLNATTLERIYRDFLSRIVISYTMN